MDLPLSVHALAALAAVVLAAFTIEAALGFGATVVTVALGGFIAPLEVVLPAFVPLNVALSLALVWRGRRDVDRRLLVSRVLPLMGLGLPLGVYVFRSVASSRLQLAFGVLVVILAAFELRGRAEASEPRLRRAGPASEPPSRAAAAALLFAAGVIHGVFATGGPLAVYVLGRELTGKAAFRATLSALWLVLNVALVVSYVTGGQLGKGTLAASAALAAPLLGGLALGEIAHRRVPEDLFRRLVFGMLLVAGVALAVRAARG